jgi:hypothetical protein
MNVKLLDDRTKSTGEENEIYIREPLQARFYYTKPLENLGLHGG